MEKLSNFLTAAGNKIHDFVITTNTRTTGIVALLFLLAFIVAAIH